MRIKLRYGRHVELTSLGYKSQYQYAMININRLMEKVDNIQEQMGNVSREMKIK